MEKWNFEASGMHCKSCSALIEQRLSKIKGVQSVNALYPEEKVTVIYNSKETGKEKIETELNSIGYSVKGSDKKASAPSNLSQAILYGLIPHIGCIGFILASILGSTLLVTVFKPLLMNPYFFHILIGISLLFATIATVVYLKSNGLLSGKGVMKKKVYIATMYGITIGVNLLLLFVIFPWTANLDTGSFTQATQPNLAANQNQGIGVQNESLLATTTVIKLSVAIPCSGHASLITGEIKTIPGVTGVRFSMPNIFEVAYTGGETTKQKILGLEVFKSYPAKIVN